MEEQGRKTWLTGLALTLAPLFLNPLVFAALELRLTPKRIAALLLFDLAALALGVFACRRSGAPTRFKRHTVFALVFFLFFLSALEGVSRLAIHAMRNAHANIHDLEYYVDHHQAYSFKNIAAWTSHPFIPYVPKAGVRDEGGLLFNSYGYRSRGEPKPGSFRIACIGSSITFGWSVKTEDTWCARLEARLRERFPDRNIEVLNFGIPSASSEMSLAQLHFKVLALQPAMVIVQQGENDAVHWAADGLRKDDYSDLALHADWPENNLIFTPAFRLLIHSAAFRLGLYLRGYLGGNLRHGYLIPNLDGWYHGVYKLPIDTAAPGYRAVPWQTTYQRNLESMVGICRIHGIDISLLENVYNLHYALLDSAGNADNHAACIQVNNVTEKTAAATGVAYIRVTVPPDSEFTDGWHLTPRGEDRKAADIFAFLERNKAGLLAEGKR
jgi:lysophospholipase L1-like esterase